MSAGNGEILQFSPEELNEILTSLADSISADGKKAAMSVAATLLEHFADRIETTKITTNSDAARQGAEAAIKAVVAEARRLAKVVRV